MSKISMEGISEAAPTSVAPPHPSEPSPHCDRPGGAIIASWDSPDMSVVIFTTLLFVEGLVASLSAILSLATFATWAASDPFYLLHMVSGNGKRPPRRLGDGVDVNARRAQHYFYGYDDYTWLGYHGPYSDPFWSHGQGRVYEGGVGASFGVLLVFLALAAIVFGITFYHRPRKHFLVATSTSVVYYYRHHVCDTGVHGSKVVPIHHIDSLWATTEWKRDRDNRAHMLHSLHVLRSCSDVNVQDQSRILLF